MRSAIAGLAGAALVAALVAAPADATVREKFRTAAVCTGQTEQTQRVETGSRWRTTFVVRAA
jgi:hypothetical protein